MQTTFSINIHITTCFKFLDKLVGFLLEVKELLQFDYFGLVLNIGTTLIFVLLFFPKAKLFYVKTMVFAHFKILPQIEP